MSFDQSKWVWSNGKLVAWDDASVHISVHTLHLGSGVFEAIRCYESQFDADRYVKVKHYVTCANGFTGARCGFLYGEQFALPHPVGGEDLFKIVHGGKGSIAPVQLPGRDHLPMN